MSIQYEDDKLLSTRELAEAIRLPEWMLVERRIKGGGPRFIKMGKALNATVRYRWGDVLEWQRQNTFADTKEFMQRGMSA